MSHIKNRIIYMSLVEGIFGQRYVYPKRHGKIVE